MKKITCNFLKRRIRFILFSLLLCSSISLFSQKFGTNQFRISDVGGTGNASYDANRSDVAYNTTNNQYLVVWEADDIDFGVLDDEFEIIGQIIAADGTEVGTDFMISNLHGVGIDATADAVYPSVAYNSVDNEYLVVWRGDRVVGEDEIYGQRISATGTLLGSNFRISDVGTDSDPNFDAITPEVVYNAIDNEYLVVWSADETAGFNNIYGQRINNLGAETGTNDFLISTVNVDPNFDGFEPQVVWNSEDNEYLVVWVNDYLSLGVEEIYGERLSNTGVLLGSNFRISNQTDASATFDAQTPSVAYNKSSNNYLVVWNGDRISGEEEIYGQLISNVGAEIGTDFKISTQGTDGDSTIGAFDPDVTWRATSNTFMVVWEGDDTLGGGTGDEEIWMQEITSTGTLTGSVLQISDLGPDLNYDSLDPKVVANTEQGLLITWRGEDNTGGLVDGEIEIYIQMYGSPTLNKNRFTAATNNLWNNSTNWILGNVPISTNDVIIPSGKTVNVDIINAIAEDITLDNGGVLNVNAGQALTINGNLTQNGTFTINSDATQNGSLIIKGSATGNVTYSRYLTTTNWHLIGAPVVGQSINGFSSSFLTNGDSEKSIALYMNNVISENRWNYYNTTTILSAGNFMDAKGYSAKITGTNYLNFTGILNTDNESILITDGGDDPAGNRWNLIANPYTASINGSNPADFTNNFLKVNIDAGNLDPTKAGLYLWNGSAPYVVKSVDDAAFYIAPGQAFFVHAPNGGGTSASFTEAMQTHQTGNIFLRNSTTYPEIILNLTDGNSNSLTKVRYIQNKTNGLDIGSDVGTFSGTSSSFEVFSHLVSNSEGINFAIQALPDSNYENMIVPIGVSAEANEEITFTADISNLPAGLKVFLEDKENNTFTRLDEENGNYKVTLTSDTNGIGRFYLHTSSSTLNIDTLTNDNVNIYKVNASTLRITGLTKQKTDIAIYNLLGKKVFHTSFEAEGIKDVVLPNFSNGIYVVQLKNNSGKLNKKIILE